ncbi:NeuD/PglB/VioB family sugar acetyltransferase [Crocinitomix catalasitica]|uniref:NeuD/PglB/VioB family sugar acetyltransferase n=1 Tax=Crocinitomix catalasitica TaxID=184607 RepID=UPI0004823E36|nr:NeuD/PglB/VioB family sugar acetyltransferase [Crocinitomix catalasitica]
MKKLAIIGAGDLGALVKHHALDSKFEVVGFFDDTLEEGSDILGVRVFGGVNKIKQVFDKGEFDVLFVAIGYKHFKFRNAIFDKYKGKIPFANIIHSSVYVDKSVELGEGIFILPGGVLDANVKIDDNVLLNTCVIIAHDTQIGAHSFLAPGCKLAGFISVGECCNIGIGTIIIDNVTISNNIQTGGGAVVVKDLKEAGLYIGLPAKLIKR